MVSLGVSETFLCLYFNHVIPIWSLFSASKDTIEAMRVTEWVSETPSASIDFTDVTLVSDDTYRILYWCDPDYSDDPDESYLVMKVI